MDFNFIKSIFKSKKKKRKLSYDENDLDPYLTPEVKYTPKPVPPELIDKWDSLQKDRTALVKAERIAIFKKMPRYLRQRLVDQHIIHEAYNNMNNVHKCVEDINKQMDKIRVEVENLDRDHYITYSGDDEYVNVTQPDLHVSNISGEELRKAHSEACADEDILEAINNTATEEVVPSSPSDSKNP